MYETKAWFHGALRLPRGKYLWEHCLGTWITWQINFDSVCFSEVLENDFQCEQPDFPGTNSLCFKYNLNDNYDNWDVEKPDSDRERGKVRLLMENNPWEYLSTATNT